MKYVNINSNVDLKLVDAQIWWNYLFVCDPIQPIKFSPYTKVTPRTILITHIRIGILPSVLHIWNTTEANEVQAMKKCSRALKTLGKHSKLKNSVIDANRNAKLCFDLSSDTARSGRRSENNATIAMFDKCDCHLSIWMRWRTFCLSGKRSCVEPGIARCFAWRT